MGGLYKKYTWGQNFIGDPQLDCYRRPIPPNSPAIIRNLQTGQVISVSGAFPIKFDFNRDNYLDDSDHNAMLQRLTGNGMIAPLSDASNFDFDCDGDIDYSDVAEFEARADRITTHTIPATSTWAQIIMGLTLTAAGILTIRSKRPTP
ncbi:MAG: EF-hand domain-containing protein [Planctomycetota bacterium]